jgi:hypothetical protein
MRGRARSIRAMAGCAGAGAAWRDPGAALRYSASAPHPAQCVCLPPRLLLLLAPPPASRAGRSGRRHSCGVRSTSSSALGPSARAAFAARVAAAAAVALLRGGRGAWRLGPLVRRLRVSLGAAGAALRYAMLRREHFSGHEGRWPEAASAITSTTSSSSYLV